jgi:Ser/Thr protein kinase RdoA (MazF antagonist)
VSAQPEAAVALLADDPAVASRDLLLDGDAVAAALAAHAGADGDIAIESCTCERAKYRAGESLRTVYRLRAGGEHWLAARSVRPARARDNLRAGLSRAVPAGPLRPLTHVPELGAVFYAFPNDRKIADLPLLADGAALEHVLGRTSARSELVAWAPEASATARWRDDHGRVLAYVKVYADEQAPRIAATHAALRRAARGAGAAAPRLGWALVGARRRALVLEPVDGTPLLALAGDERAAALERLGAALAALHGLAIPAVAPPFERLAPGRLATAAEVIARARPDAAGPARALAATLRAAVPGREREPVCLHGDPHPGNVVVADGEIGLVDLDHVAHGPAAADLARVLAGLTVERLLGRIEVTTEGRWADGLLGGYAEVRPLPGARDLRWHVAASLLARQALPAVSRVRPEALAVLPTILAIARELVR